MLDDHHVRSLDTLRVLISIIVGPHVSLDELNIRGRDRDRHRDLLILGKALLQATRGILMYHNNDWTSTTEN